MAHLQLINEDENTKDYVSYTQLMQQAENVPVGQNNKQYYDAGALASVQTKEPSIDFELA